METRAPVVLRPARVGVIIFFLLLSSAAKAQRWTDDVFITEGYFLIFSILFYSICSQNSATVCFAN